MKIMQLINTQQVAVYIKAKYKIGFSSPDWKKENNTAYATYPFLVNEFNIVGNICSFRCNELVKKG